MNYKYGKKFNDFLQALEEFYYKKLPILDFDSNNVVFIENHTSITQNTIKLLLKSQENFYGIKAAEDEIIATYAIESITLAVMFLVDYNGEPLFE